VDDHDVVHWGFRLLLTQQRWVERCLSARAGEEALELTRRFEPHVALVDLFIGQESGAEICERLRAERPAPKVLLISGAGRISKSAARAAGAAGFVSKDWPSADIVKAVYRVASGKLVFQPAREPAAAALTDREREVLGLMAEGRTNRAIAEQLVVSSASVEKYVTSIFAKLGLPPSDADHRRVLAVLRYLHS